MEILIAPIYRMHSQGRSLGRACQKYVSGCLKFPGLVLWPVLLKNSHSATSGSPSDHLSETHFLTTPALTDNTSLTAVLKSDAGELGFDLIGIAPAVSPPGYHPLLEWIASGYAADMDWISQRQNAYQHPDGVLPGTRSVIVVAMNYHNQQPHTQQPETAGRISRYAWGTQDYHKVIRRRLKQLLKSLQQHRPDSISRAVVDTAPLLERDFAQLAGLGWRGKNTMLISRNIGSWFFLGAILTTAELQYDQPHVTDHCGTCSRCLDACPTNAFPEPYVLDSRRCISYLTIERRDSAIPESLRNEIGDWVFGCDICQEVCPWNRFAPKQSDVAFHPREDLWAVDIPDLLKLTEQTFSMRFAGTPLHRTGRNIIVRNAAIVAGNRKIATAVEPLTALLTDPSELVREAVTWALTRISER